MAKNQPEDFDMGLLWTVVLVLSPAIAYGLGLVFVAFYKPRCPRCHRFALLSKQHYFWSGLNPQGKRTGGAYKYWFCSHCQVKLRCDLHQWRGATDDEWQREAEKTNGK
jgi:hypothetical protein